ncbi:MAG: polyprenyl synthetase family protein, partial [Acutalibacteraceae bacterium]
SLIHDDLPCMDDDDLRRGKPSCHIKFGEDIALLAGDGLLSLAFDTIASADQNKISAQNIVRAVKALGYCSGAYGMVGGQVIDLQSEGKKTDLETLQAMHRGKTGMMIICAALLGCYGADASEAQIMAAKSYSADIGMVFQIIDDILDVTGDEKILGKPIGSDSDNSKTTYATIYSIEECRKLALRLNERAKNTITECFGDKAENLCELADMLLERNS